MNLHITRAELLIINNSLNEALELLDEVDYTTRIGATEKEIKELLLKIQKELDK